MDTAHERYIPGEQAAEESSSRTLASDVFERLHHDILECRLKPGARLRFADLRTRYGVGTSPLREALMRLASDGLVVLEDHRGFHVAPVSRQKLLDITFMRKELEVKALVLGIRNADEHWEARVLAAYHALTRRSRPYRNGSMDPEWELRHRAFHAALVSGCGSEWLLRFRSILYDQWDRYRRLSIKYAKDDRDFMREHRELMEAALERDADAAAYLMNKHITMSTRLLLEADPAILGG
ncbi:MAG TPA: FCD domain-containing protein [Casimicrobiaceae bacterium]|nr:FCD domain-containing protein [Casimicrobiaceae bacterium]